MTAPSATAPAPRLAAGATAAASYSFVFANLAAFVRLAWVWIALAYIAGFAAGYIGVRSGSFYLARLGTLAVIICAAAFSVKWHRLVLLGPDGVGPVLAFGRREFTFIGRAILLLLAAYIPVLAIAFLVVMAMFINEDTWVVFLLAGLGAILVLCLLLVRFGLIFTAASIDAREFGWGASWKTTRGAALRLWAGLLAATLPLSLVVVVMEQALFPTLLMAGLLLPAFALGIAATVIVFLIVALAATFMSLVYRALVPTGVRTEGRPGV
jgi:hypothetical protein